MKNHLAAIDAAKITHHNKPARPSLSDLPFGDLRRWGLGKLISEAGCRGYSRTFLEIHKDDIEWLKDLGFALNPHSKDDEEAIYLNERLVEEKRRLIEFATRLDEKTNFLQVIFNTRVSRPDSFLEFLGALFSDRQERLDVDAFLDGISTFPLAGHVDFRKYQYLIEEVLRSENACRDIQRRIMALDDSDLYTPKPIDKGFIVSWDSIDAASISGCDFCAARPYWFSTYGQRLLGILFADIERKSTDGVSHTSIFMSQLEGAWCFYESYDQQPESDLSAPCIEIVVEIIQFFGYGVAQRDFTVTYDSEDGRGDRRVFWELIIYWPSCIDQG